ncbi:hypothetical protein ACOSP7_025798 [Xanthoceras sorbifolium]
MQDPANDLLPPPSSSPTISSVSSSDLDTESTGSFFHDRSTTLGTLMGVSFPAITFRAPSQSRDGHVTANAAGGGVSGTRSKNKNKKKKRGGGAPDVSAAARRRWRWWRLCSDDSDAKPASLGEFLEVERRFGDSTFFDAAAEELEGVMVMRTEEEPPPPPRNGRVLFADGRVLPPAASDAGDDDETSSTAEVLCRFPVSITNICR